MKIQRRPAPMVLPVPVVMVSIAGADGGEPDIITPAWAGGDAIGVLVCRKDLGGDST
jgi:hypothetical protein